MDDMRGRIAAGTRELLSWAPGVRLEDIPPEALARTMLVIADDMAAVVASRNEPQVTRAQRQLLGGGQGAALQEATVFRGGRSRTDRYSAAVANGIAADWAELDGGFRKAVCHAGLCTLPALLAEAEAERLTLGEVLRCAALAYEVTTRFARCWSFPPPLIHHPHAVWPALGSAVAVGLARRAGAQHLLDAATGAATLTTVGPFNHAVKGALVRNVWAASGAWNGMRSVDWAGFGIGGLADTPHDIYTIALGGHPEPEALTDGLGQSWGVRDGYHKMHACCQYSHSAVEAALSILAEGRLEPGTLRVDRVRVETHPLGMALDNFQPGTTLAAKFSIPQIVAATLHYGHAGAEAFSSESLTLAPLAAVREKVELKPFEPLQPWPNDRPARVTVELNGGRTYSGECLSARGGPDRPFSQDEVLGKIAALTGPVYPAFGDIAAELIGLPPARLRQGWDEVVADLTVNGDS